MRNNKPITGKINIRSVDAVTTLVVTEFGKVKSTPRDKILKSYKK